MVWRFPQLKAREIDGAKMASACVSIRKPRLKAGIMTGRNIPVINDNFMSH